MKYSEFRNQFSTVESFRQVYGRLSFEEAKALIDAESCAPFIKACMISTWRDARREVLLKDIKVLLNDSGELIIVFHEDNSRFDGNDFQYSYFLDEENKKAFIETVPHRYEDDETNIQEWLIANINYNGIGSDLREKWAEMGLHGSYVVREDYPGGIYREEKF